MIGLILTVLKGIGIILLCILLFVLALAAVILLVPIRYEGTCAYEEGKPQVNLKVHWLLHLLQVKGWLEEKKFQLQIRILFFVVFPRKQKKNFDAKERQQGSPEKQIEAGRQIDTEKQIEAVYEPQTKSDHKAEKIINPQEKEKAASDCSKQIETVADTEAKQDAKTDSNDRKSEKASGMETPENGDTDKKDPKTKKAKSSSKIENLGKQLTSWKEILFSNQMKQALSKVMKRVGALIRHILPRRIRGQVHFGFEDPSLTGKILSYLAMLYPFIGTEFSVDPDFEQKVLEGHLSFRGRIRIGTIAVIAVSILLDKNIRRQIKLIKQGGKAHGKAGK